MVDLERTNFTLGLARDSLCAIERATQEHIQCYKLVVFQVIRELKFSIKIVDKAAKINRKEIKQKRREEKVTYNDQKKATYSDQR